MLVRSPTTAAYEICSTSRQARRSSTDHVYLRTTNRTLEAYLKSGGTAQGDILISYTPSGHSDWQNIVGQIKSFGSSGKKTAVVSTINGDASIPFYKELGN